MPSIPLLAEHQVRPLQGRWEWDALGNDPQFLCSAAAVRGLAAGWYLVDLGFSADRSLADDAALYPDYGDGFRECLRIPLRRLVRNGRISGVVLFQADIVRLRFDPCVSPGQFSLSHMALRKLRRPEALLLMLLRGSRGGRENSKRGMVATAFLIFVTQGARAMAAHLYHDQIGISHSELSQREYRRWLESHDRASVLSSSGGSVQQQTLISVLLPVYNTPPDVLIACLESVLAQTCGRWELCISDDASTRRDTADVLVRYAGRDPRIRIEKRASNGHISAATNTALAMAGGEFVALLDHDDLLHPDAILEVVTAACANPEWHLIYTDEDKLDRRGRRSDPYFKPDYNPELLTAQNYISHLGVYRTAIVRELGGFQIGYEGCQDWDLALRFCERVGASAIGHIPKVLYHWRMSATSTAEDTSVKPYVQQVAMKVLTDHVRRVRPGASVRRLNWPYGAFRVQEGPPADEHVSVIVWEQAGQPIDCLGNMFETLGSTMSVEVIIPVNNGNIAKRWFGDHVPGALSLKVLGTTNTNPAESRNEAARMAKGSILVFVNKDIDAFSKGWLDELVAQARRPDIGVVGAKIYDPRGWVTDGAFVLGGAGGINVAFGGLDSAAVGPRARALHVQDVSAVSGACMAMRANVFHSIGGFSHASVESLVAADLCLRIRANGYRTIWTPYVELYMHEISGASPVQGQNVHGERAWLFQHYPKELLADPFYSTNLEATPAHFKLAT